MTVIGTAVLQVIPSLDGVSAAVDKQLGGKLVSVGKKGGKELAKGVGEGLKDLEKAVDEAAKSYNKLRDKAADALGKVRVEEEKLAKAREGGKSDQIAAAEERLAKARRDSGRAVREAESGHRALVDSQKRLADGADDSRRRLSSLGSSMRSVGAVAGGAALAGVTALATGLVVAGKNLYELGAQFDDLSDTLQVKTGLSGAALDKLTASVEKLGTTKVPSSFAEIGNVAAEVSRSLHLTGDDFDAVTSRLANLSRWGQDVDIRSLGKVFRGFGIEAKNQAGALNTLYEISTKTGLSIDDLTGAMAKGGPAMRQLNLDFGESAALLASFEQAGLDGEKATVALNKAFAYFSKEGIPAKQGLTDIIARIQQLGDLPEAGELANKVFGAKGGAQFLEAIQTGALDLQNLQSALQLTGLDINQVSEDTADWAERWQDLKNELSVALKPVATPLFDTINDKLDDLSTWVTSHQDEVIDFFVGLGETAISTAQVATTALGGLVKAFQLFDWVILNTLGRLPGADRERGQEFNDQLKDLADNLNAAADSGIWDDLREELRGFGDDVKNAAGNTDDATDSFDGLGTAAKSSTRDVENLSDALKDLSKTPLPGLLGVPGAPNGLPAGQNPLTIPLGPGVPGSSSRGSVGSVGPGGRPIPGQSPVNPQDLPPLTTSGETYGLPAGTDIRQGAPGFPDWVYKVAEAFGLQASTYAGHQEDRGEGNQGIDWWGPLEKRQAFAEFLAANAASIPGLEDVIFRNPETGQDIGVNNGRIVGTPGSADPGYFRRGRNDFLDHTDHVHTTQSMPIPVPGGWSWLQGLSSTPSSVPSTPAGIPQDATREQVIAALAACARAEGLSEDEVAGVLALAQAESDFNRVGFLGFSTQTADTGYTGGAPYANDFNKAMDKFFENYKKGGLAAGGGPEVLAAARAALAQGDPGPYLQWLQNGLQGAVAGQGGMNYEFGPNLSKFYNQWRGSAPTTSYSTPASPGADVPVALNNAFGPGYEPGIGTPGFDEYGDPGYYRVDPKDVREAQQRIDDQMERIREADEARKQAQAAIDDLEVDADQSEIDAANERKRKADYDFQVANRELEDLKGELSEAQQGSFTPAKESPKSKSGKGFGGLNLGTSLSGIGSALGEFAGGQIGSFLDVFGVGDSPGWLKGLSTFIGGISVSDANGNSLFNGGSFNGAAPSAAFPGMAAPPNVHGAQAGQQPGPVYNIQARDTEDAFVRAQRLERERTATKLARY